MLRPLRRDIDAIWKAHIVLPNGYKYPRSQGETAMRNFGPEPAVISALACYAYHAHNTPKAQGDRL